ncbi:hypothetical protein JCM10449v2_007422 [Rhodotorula kratochvilovae]
MARSVERPRPRAASLPSLPSSPADSIRAVNPSPVKRRPAPAVSYASSPAAPQRSPPNYSALLARQPLQLEPVGTRSSRVLKPVRSFSDKLTSTFKRDLPSAPPSSPTSTHATCGLSSPLPAPLPAPFAATDLIRPGGPPLKRFKAHLAAPFVRKARIAPAHAAAARTPYKAQAAKDPKTQKRWGRLFRRKKADAGDEVELAAAPLPVTPAAVRMRKRGRVSTGSARSRIAREEALVEGASDGVGRSGMAAAKAYYATLSSPRRPQIQLRPALSSRKKPRRVSLSPASKAKVINRPRPVSRAMGRVGYYAGSLGGRGAGGGTGRREGKDAVGGRARGVEFGDEDGEAEWLPDEDSAAEQDATYESAHDDIVDDAAEDSFARSLAPSPASVRPYLGPPSSVVASSTAFAPIAPLRISQRALAPHRLAPGPSRSSERPRVRRSSAGFDSPEHRALSASIFGMLPSSDDTADGDEGEAFDDAPEDDENTDGGVYEYATPSARSDEAEWEEGEDEQDVEYVDARPYPVDRDLDGAASIEGATAFAVAGSSRPASSAGSLSSSPSASVVSDASAQDLASARVVTASWRVSAASEAPAPQLDSLSPKSRFEVRFPSSSSPSPSSSSSPSAPAADGQPLARALISSPAFRAPNKPEGRAALQSAGRRVFGRAAAARPLSPLRATEERRSQDEDDDGGEEPLSVGSAGTVRAAGWVRDEEGHWRVDGGGGKENEPSGPVREGAGGAASEVSSAKGRGRRRA